MHVALSYKEKYIKGFYKKMLNACGFCGLSYKEKYIKSFFYKKGHFRRNQSIRMIWYLYIKYSAHNKILKL